MRNLTRVCVAWALGGAAIVANAATFFPSIDDMGLTSLSDSEMSTLRGGFVSINDTIINIGLSMTTAIDGETVLSSHIADLTINNGLLVSNDGSGAAYSFDPITVIQKDDNDGDNTNDNFGINSINTVVPSGDATGVIIQNTADGIFIYNETVLNIEADVSSFNQQAIFHNRLQDAILNTGY